MIMMSDVMIVPSVIIEIRFQDHSLVQKIQSFNWVRFGKDKGLWLGCIGDLLNR